MADPRANKLGPEPLVAEDGEAVAPNDGADLPNIGRCLYIGGDGDVVLQTYRGTQLTFVACKAGTIIPLRAKRVLASGTTATNILNLW